MALVVGAIAAPVFAAALGIGELLWSYLLGLAAIIALGVIGTYYAYVPRVQGETDALAEEFEIE